MNNRYPASLHPYPFIYGTLAMVGRLLPHIPNVAPVTAVSLMSGGKFSFATSLLAIFPGLLVSDYLLGVYDWRVMLSVYASYLLIIAIGKYLHPTRNMTNLLTATLLASLIFFIITNLAVWVTSPAYSKDLVGLLECFTMALPFFRNSLIGDLGYGFLLYALHHLPLNSRINIFALNTRTAQ